MLPRYFLISSLSFVSHVSAWGSLGHETVAFIAQNFISKKTAAFTQRLLNDSSSSYLANVATWADSYRYTTEGAFSAPLHYIDALDTPPTSCNVDFERDCPEEGCITSAIANYTERIQARNISLVERQKALKWVIHFTGDTHQPLHVENLEVGGNTINVTFQGVVRNLHSVWDTYMPEKLIGGYSLENARGWAADLTKEIVSGKYANVSDSWLDGIDIKDPLETAMVWARDGNSYVCTTVVPEGAEAVRNQELSGAYYESSIGVIQMQIAKAGYRLAAWLDAIVEGPHGYGKKHHDSWKKVHKGGYEKRGLELEDWMKEARQARRDAGWLCDHEH